MRERDKKRETERERGSKSHCSSFFDSNQNVVFPIKRAPNIVKFLFSSIVQSCISESYLFEVCCPHTLKTEKKKSHEFPCFSERETERNKYQIKGKQTITTKQNNSNNNNNSNNTSNVANMNSNTCRQTRVLSFIFLLRLLQQRLFRQLDTCGTFCKLCFPVWKFFSRKSQVIFSGEKTTTAVAESRYPLYL